MNGAPRDPMELIGVPYTRGGSTPAEGFDCFTLLQWVRREFFHRVTPIIGIPSPRLPSAQAAAFAIYRTLGGAERMASPWYECGRADGVAVAMAQWKVSRLHHCGVVVGAGVLHALTGCGVVWTPFDRLGLLYARVEFFECPNS